MTRDIGPYVGSLLRKHFSGYDRPVSIEKSAGTVDLSQTLRKDAELDPSLYASQTVGNHPDYDHLRFSDNVVPGKITTLFADLKNFSALGMFIDPSEVKTIKRQVLGLWMDSVRLMGGHIHSIDGDGLMVFFGGSTADPAQATYQAVAAGVNLSTLTYDDLNPLLEDQGYDKVRVRVGIDHDPDMRWGRVGLPPDQYEVKGTGFGIDFAAKMQQSRKSGFVMVGEELVKLINIPDDYLLVHTYTQNGQDVEDRNFRRTYHGEEKTYSKRKFDFDKMFREIGGEKRVATDEDIRHICTGDETEDRNITPAAAAAGVRTHPENEEFA